MNLYNDAARKNNDDLYSSTNQPKTQAVPVPWNAQFISKQRKQLKSQGYLLLNVEENFWTLLAKEITKGKFLTQDYGEWCYDVKATPEFSHLADSKSSNPIQWHTDNPHERKPTKYLALSCVHPAAEGGSTLLSDTKTLLEHHLKKDEIQALSNRQYEWMDKSLKNSIKRPILSNTLSKPIWRFSQNILLKGNPSPEIGSEIIADEYTQNLCDKIQRTLDRQHVSIQLQKNDLLIFNNRRMFHSRTAFNGLRHLKRLWLV